MFPSPENCAYGSETKWRINNRGYWQTFRKTFLSYMIWKVFLKMFRWRCERVWRNYHQRARGKIKKILIYRIIKTPINTIDTCLNTLNWKLIKIIILFILARKYFTFLLLSRQKFKFRARPFKSRDLLTNLFLFIFLFHWQRIGTNC